MPNLSVFNHQIKSDSYALTAKSVPNAIGNFPQPSLILFKINIFVAGISLAFTYFNRNNIKRIPWVILTIISLANTAIQVWAATLFIVFMLSFDTKKKELFNRLASSRTAKYFGDTAYSVYLVHTMIYVPILYALFQYKWFIDLHIYFRLIVAFILTSIPIYAISYLLYRVVEIPGINIGRNVLLRKKLTKHST